MWARWPSVKLFYSITESAGKEKPSGTVEFLCKNPKICGSAAGGHEGLRGARQTPAPRDHSGLGPSASGAAVAGDKVRVICGPCVDCGQTPMLAVGEGRERARRNGLAVQSARLSRCRRMRRHVRRRAVRGHQKTVSAVRPRCPPTSFKLSVHDCYYLWT